MSLGEAYAFAFYRLRTWAQAFADDNLHDWKAILAIGFAQVFVVYGTIFLIEGLSKRTFLPGEPWHLALPLSIAIISANYYLLLHQDRWKRYKRKFRQ